MAVSRVFSRSHLVLRAGASYTRISPSAIASINSSLPRRTFTSSVSKWEEIVQTPSRGPEVSLTDNRATSTGNPANSIALLRISKRLSRAEIEEMLRGKGFNIKRLQMRVDRFTFQNDTQCFVELGSPAEAKRAVDQLNKTEIHQKKIIAAPLKDDFRWGSVEDTSKLPFGSRYFFDEGNAAEEAIRPLTEGRRTLLSVQTPGWSPKSPIRQSKDNALNIIGQNFGQYGIERVGDMSPFFGDKKTKPRMLCLIDFKTKEGAEQAIKEKHDTEINGLLVWLRHSEPSAWRQQQYWKTAPKPIEELQEKGVLSKEMYEDKFVSPLPRKSRR
ncbi:hypothetical protein yc1106_03969 [Curvularia clavata]|uniref:RRM domain-containing protein n=1 Tax=Curvularia clavata TaxID=95742 RepID=A0A9Q8Z6Q7_CURCL|nr:hypothetical protein yc1106_03969 [Curvularia clavata]